MRGVNKVILVGVVGQDVERKDFPNGGCVATFSLATNESWIDKQTGERKESTEWHRCSTNNRLAEIASQYVRKGSKLYIEGSLRTRQWTDQNGQERYTTEIRCENLQMLDSNNNQGNKSQGGYGNNNQGNNNQGGYGNNNQGNNNQGGYGNNNQGSNNQGGYGNNNRSNSNNDDPDLPF